MARMVATKAALSIRIDALSDADSRSDAQAAEVGVTNRVKLESRLRALEHRAGIQSVRRVTTGTARPTPRWEMNGAVKDSGYNNANDSVKLESVREMLPTQPVEAVAAAVQAVTEVKDEKRREKEERKAAKKEKRKSVGPVVDPADVSMDVDEDEKPGETKEERKARKEAKKAVSLGSLSA
jgi:nucleolar protein 58